MRKMNYWDGSKKCVRARTPQCAGHHRMCAFYALGLLLVELLLKFVKCFFGELSTRGVRYLDAGRFLLHAPRHSVKEQQ